WRSGSKCFSALVTRFSTYDFKAGVTSMFFPDTVIRTSSTVAMGPHPFLWPRLRPHYVCLPAVNSFPAPPSLSRRAPVGYDGVGKTLKDRQRPGNTGTGLGTLARAAEHRHRLGKTGDDRENPRR